MKWSFEPRSTSGSAVRCWQRQTGMSTACRHAQRAGWGRRSLPFFPSLPSKRMLPAQDSSPSTRPARSDPTRMPVPHKPRTEINPASLVRSGNLAEGCLFETAGRGCRNADRRRNAAAASTRAQGKQKLFFSKYKPQQIRLCSEYRRDDAHGGFLCPRGRGALRTEKQAQLGGAEFSC